MPIPGNRAARQRIGAVVAERARELEDQGSREQALQLYEQATALRGDGTGAVGRAHAAAAPRGVAGIFRQGLARVPHQHRAGDHVLRDERALRPGRTSQAALKLKDARLAREKLDKIDKDARKP